MRIRRSAVGLAACLVVFGCASLKPQYPRPIKVQHHKTYPREQRFWAGENGDVQGFVLPLTLVSPKKNQSLQDATKGEFTFFVVAMHHKTSDEGLSQEKLAPSIRMSIRDAPVTNVDAMAAVAPLIRNRMNELTAERSRLAREVSTVEPTPAPAAPPAPGAEAAPAKSADTQAELTKVENDLNLLASVRAYLRPGRIDTKRGIVWYQILAIPGKEDIAATQSVQWGYGEGGQVDMQEYGYKFDMLDKLKLKQIAERPLPGFLPTYLKEWMEK